MGLQIRQALSSDKGRWNHYVHAHPQASAYHNFAWVESVQQAYGHPNISLIALDDDKVVGVLPVIKMLRPLSGHYLCSLPFCDIGHAVADNEDIARVLLEQLQRLKSSTGATHIEYRDTSPATTSSASDDHELQGKRSACYCRCRRRQHCC